MLFLQVILATILVSFTTPEFIKTINIKYDTYIVIIFVIITLIIVISIS